MSDDEFPKGLLYNKDYSWVKIEGKTATVGIIGPSAKKVEEFVFIKLPENGIDIKRGDNYVSVEAVKWSGHLSSPISGKIIAVNGELFNEPSEINRDPYGSWIMKVEMSDDDYKKELLGPEEAEKWFAGKK